jgi:hypothetical protein
MRPILHAAALALATILVGGGCSRDTALPFGDDLGGPLDRGADGTRTTDGATLPDDADGAVLPPPDLALACGALRTADTGQRAIAQYDQVLDPPEGLTVEAWVFPSGWSFPDRVALVDHLYAIEGEAGYQLAVLPANRVEFRVVTGTEWKVTSQAAALPVGKWTHVAAVYDVAALQMTMFIDGRESDAIKIARDMVPVTGVWLSIGAGLGPGEPSFDGFLDEVRISRGARYTGPFQRATRFDPDPYTAALYHFDDVGQPTARDASTNHLDATLEMGAAMVTPVPCL